MTLYGATLSLKLGALCYAEAALQPATYTKWPGTIDFYRGTIEKVTDKLKWIPDAERPCYMEPIVDALGKLDIASLNGNLLRRDDLASLRACQNSLEQLEARIKIGIQREEASLRESAASRPQGRVELIDRLCWGSRLPRTED